MTLCRCTTTCTIRRLIENRDYRFNRFKAGISNREGSKTSLKGSKTSAKYSKTHQIIEGLQQGLYGGVCTKYKCHVPTRNLKI